MFLLTRAVTTGGGSRGATDGGGSGGGVTATGAGNGDGAGGSADGVGGTDDASSMSILKQEYLEIERALEYSRGSVLTNGMDTRD